MSAFVKRKHNIYFLFWSNELGKQPSHLKYEILFVQNAAFELEKNTEELKDNNKCFVISFFVNQSHHY